MIITTAPHWQLRWRIRAAPSAIALHCALQRVPRLFSGLCPGRRGKDRLLPVALAPWLLPHTCNSPATQNSESDWAQHFQSQLTSLRACRFPVRLKKGLSIYCCQQIFLFSGNDASLQSHVNFLYYWKKFIYSGLQIQAKSRTAATKVRKGKIPIIFHINHSVKKCDDVVGNW